jgi:hypothetical protein
VTPDCNQEERLRRQGKDDQVTPFDVSDRLDALAQQVDPDGNTFTPWIRATDVRDVPAVLDDRPR